MLGHVNWVIVGPSIRDVCSLCFVLTKCLFGNSGILARADYSSKTNNIASVGYYGVDRD
jgi:hypothetical protein